ncbi:hypothetical protein POSPLADRAFT_1145671 [Postia placenta MAD-698-R-SB12]|uniref:Uncharacterized protein n=1 Tax=Postia placenta MAD-698-R-SB12 TaxID=670580 RepID=A0A1X6MYQ0_9APHY|nr:hypothetical protein POSPLADRAFT_1145671 [Postia placenta MAD-698-R-SB12]OSX61477.1 hypothetical protein POSPLADRAFT_1145671 [Postia placenta MAD-698-R-SB12]
MSVSSMDEAQFLQYAQYSLIDGYMDIMAMMVCHHVNELISDLLAIATACGTYFAQASFASIRVYALDSRRWMKAAIVMMLGLMPVAINIYGASKTVMTHTAEGCFLGYSYSTFRSHMYVTPSPHRISTVVLCHFFLDLRYFSSLELNDSTISSRGSPSLSFASRIIGNLGEMLVENSQAYDDDVDRELEDPTDSEEVNAAVDLDDSVDKAQTRTATTEVLDQTTSEGGAADCGLPESPDEDFDPRVIEIV